LLAGVGVFCSVVSSLLGGSKSAIFSLLFLLVLADYVQNLKLSASNSLSEVLALTKKIRTLRAYGIACGIGSVILLPAYLILIRADLGGGSGAALQGFAARLFGGFDAVAIVAYKDIDLLSIHDVNIVDFYFYPLIKKISHTPNFQSSGEYLIYQLSGNYQFAASGLNPNSSLSIELLLSNGSLAISIGVIALTAALIFRWRTTLLRREGLRMLDLLFWAFCVLAPFSVLLDGAYFVIRFYEVLGLYMILNLIMNAIDWLESGRMELWFL